MDDNNRVIDFNELKNKAKDKDVDKLEDYMYSLYYDMAEGKITMADFTKSMYKYMEDNNISQDKFLNIQKKLMERYGFDSSALDNQLKNIGMSIDGIENDYESVRKTLSFQEKYKDNIKTGAVSFYKIKNDKNDLELMMKENEVLIESTGKVDLNDNELSEFLCSYKKVNNDKPLSIKVCEDIKTYEY